MPLGHGVSFGLLEFFLSNSYDYAQGLAVAWSTIVIFDLVVVIMTLVKTITINRQSGKDCTLTGILIRDGKGNS